MSYEYIYDVISGYDISNISELIIIVVLYSIFEAVKYYKRRESNNKTIGEMRRHIKRLEYLNAVQHFPDKKEWITGLYGEYKALGGNSYVDKMHSEWLIDINSKKEKNESNKENNHS